MAARAFGQVVQELKIKQLGGRPALKFRWHGQLVGVRQDALAIQGFGQFRQGVTFGFC